MRGTVLVEVAFRAGPSLRPLLERIGTVGDLEWLGRHSYRATFRLDSERRGFGTLATLIGHVGGKRSTTVLVNGYREMQIIVKAMAQCAGPFAYGPGRCEFVFESAVPARCRACPLFDEERAEAMIAAFLVDTHRTRDGS